MENSITFSVKLLISFILSGSILFAGTSLIRYFDPTFSISLFDLLSQVNYSAWLLLALLAGIIFGVLSLLPVFGVAERRDDRKSDGGNQGMD